MRRRREKAAVVSGGYTIPLCPEIVAALGRDLEGAAVYQQLLFLQLGRGVLHEWRFLPLTAAAFKVAELMSDDTLAKRIKKLVGLGVIEAGEKKGRHTAYRVRPDKLERLVREYFPEFVAYDPWTTSGIANPQPADEPSGVERDTGRLLFPRAQEEVEEEVEIEEEKDNDNDNYKHVRSEAPKEDNSTGEVGTAIIDHACTSCGGLVKRGDDLLHDLHGNPFHPTCLEAGVGA